MEGYGSSSPGPGLRQVRAAKMESTQNIQAPAKENIFFLLIHLIPEHFSFVFFSIDWAYNMHACCDLVWQANACMYGCLFCIGYADQISKRTAVVCCIDVAFLSLI